MLANQISMQLYETIIIKYGMHYFSCLNLKRTKFFLLFEFLSDVLDSEGAKITAEAKTSVYWKKLIDN